LDDEIGNRGKSYIVIFHAGFDAEGNSKMSFSRAWITGKDRILSTFDKIETFQHFELIHIFFG